MTTNDVSHFIRKGRIKYYIRNTLILFAYAHISQISAQKILCDSKVSVWSTLELNTHIYSVSNRSNDSTHFCLLRILWEKYAGIEMKNSCNHSLYYYWYESQWWSRNSQFFDFYGLAVDNYHWNIQEMLFFFFKNIIE